MAYLFDTDAISELMKKAPAKGYLAWAAEVRNDELFASAVTVGELFQGAYRSSRVEYFVQKVEADVLPVFQIIDFNVGIAREYGRLRAGLEQAGTPLAEADLQIGATAVWLGMPVVTGNVRHFGRVPGLRVLDFRGM